MNRDTTGVAVVNDTGTVVTTNNGTHDIGFLRPARRQQVNTMHYNASYCSIFDEFNPTILPTPIKNSQYLIDNRDTLPSFFLPPHSGPKGE